MIAGVFLRNFKAYSNLSFIPFIEDPSEKVTVFIGENGVGKSTLLEAVNCFIQKVHSSQWEITVDQNGKSAANKISAYIGVVFLIRKTDFPEAETVRLDHISDSFWQSDFSSTWSTDAVKSFEKWRKLLIDNGVHNDNYLIVIGRNYDDEVKLTSFAHDRIMQQNKRNGLSRENLIAIYEQLLKSYGYIYIPVENKVSDVLRLQALELQELMNKKMVSEISDVFEDHDSDGRSIVDLINGKLDNYVVDINSRLNDGYKFESSGDDESKLKTSDIINLVFAEYFSRKILKKDGKNIKSLSSGQQRLALIDVVTTILGKNDSRVGRICLALDEPENSLDNLNRLNQFIKLFDLTGISSHQILITTHWYGLLLRPVNGRLIFIDNGVDEVDAGNKKRDESIVAKNANSNFRSFSLLNLYDQRRNFPDSVEMKSYFDLMASLWSVIRKSKKNWIICEGYEDYQYLNYHLQGKVNDLTILPMNGCGNVKKFYELLRVPLSDKGERAEVKGKVFCLIDSDPTYLKVENYTPYNNLTFRKLLLNNDGTVLKLASVSETNARRTTIEDVLDVKTFVKCFQELCDHDAELTTIKGRLIYEDNAKFVDISETLSFINPASFTKADDILIKRCMAKDVNKRFLANKYLEISPVAAEILPWQKEMVNFFEA